MTKTKTMAATAAEAKDIVGKEKRGKTRQETAETPKLKKTKTMAETVKVERESRARETTSKSLEES